MCMTRRKCSLTIPASFFPPPGVELNKPTHFTVNTKGAGKANLDCSFSGPTKAEAVKDFEIINNHDNTHTVKYTPVQQVRDFFFFNRYSLMFRDYCDFVYLEVNQ